MSDGYSYQTQRPYVLTDKGQRAFLTMRDWVISALTETGAVRTGNAMSHCGGGDSWDAMACVDRLLELGDVREIPTSGAWQDRIFVSNRRTL